MIQNLGHLAAITNDYIYEPDGSSAAKLFIRIARDIGGDKAANEMIDAAEYYTSLRKDAKNSNPSVKEETENE